MTPCDVGQGDLLVVALRDGHGAVAIDVGPSAKEIDSCLSDLGVHHVSALVLTHFHADRVGGLTGLIDGRRVDAVFATVHDEPVEQFRGAGVELRRRGMSMRRSMAGSTLDVGSSTYEVLWPRRIITGGRISDGSVANNGSPVLEANLGGVRVLLTGDIEAPAQAALVSGPGGGLRCGQDSPPRVRPSASAFRPLGSGGPRGGECGIGQPPRAPCPGHIAGVDRYGCTGGAHRSIR